MICSLLARRLPISGLFLAFLTAHAADNAIPLDPEVLHGSLPNGLVYYIQHNATPKEQVELRLAVNAGSVEEDEDQRGLAHLIEHLCFRSTRHFPNTEIVHYLQALGSSFGADINAQTGMDDTVFKLSIPSAKPKALNQGLLMLRDWAGDVNFDQADVDKERKVVVEEWRIGRGSAQRLFQKEAPIFFQGSRYADRLPIGLKTTIEGATLATIQRFYHDWYRPDNMAVIVVGDVDPKAIQSRLYSLFGDLRNPPYPRAKPDLSVTLPKAIVCSSASDPELGYTAVRLWSPSVTHPVATIGDYRQYLVRQLALLALNSRLAELKEASPSPYEFAQVSFSLSPARAMSVATFVAIVENGGATAGLKALVQEGDLIGRQGFTQQEFELGLATLRKAIEERYATHNQRESADLAGNYVATFLHDDPSPGPQWDYDTSRALAAKLTLQDMNAVCRSLLGQPGLIVSVESPQSDASPGLASDQLAKIVAQAHACQMISYREKAPPNTLMPKLMTPGKMISKISIPAIGVTEITLSNGVRVVLKPSEFKNDEIVYSAYRAGGFSQLPEDLALAAAIAPGYIGQAGLGAYSATDLQKILAGRQVVVVMQSTPCLDVFKGRCATADLETALELIHMSFSPLRRDEAAYRSVVAQFHSFEANVALNPTLSFLNDALDIRFGHNPRGPHLIQPEADWKTLTLDKVLQAYHDRFGMAGGFTFIFVGSFKEAEIEPLLARYLGSLPEGDRKAEWKDIGIRQIPGPFKKILQRGSDPKALVVLDYDLPMPGWDYHQSHILWSLANILQRALIDKLRIDQGEVYNLKADSKYEMIPYAHYTLEIVAPCAPFNTAKVVQVVNSEIERLGTQGPTAAEIEKEVASQEHDLQVQAEQNNDWLWKLERIYQYNEGFERLESPEALVHLVTQANIQAAAKKDLATDKWVELVMQPN